MMSTPLFTALLLAPLAVLQAATPAQKPTCPLGWRRTPYA